MIELRLLNFEIKDLKIFSEKFVGIPKKVNVLLDLNESRVTCNDREHKFAFKIVASEMNDLQTKEFIHFLLLLLLLLLFPFIRFSCHFGIKRHLFHYRHVIMSTEMTKKTRKCK